MVKSFFKTVLTANQQPTNIVAGDSNEFITFDAYVEVRAVTSGASALISVFVDQDLVMDQKIVPYVGSTLVDKDHVVVGFHVAEGSRILIKLSENAGATPTVYTGFEASPV